MGRRTAVFINSRLPSCADHLPISACLVHAGCESSCRTEIHAGHDSMANPAETFPQRSFWRLHDAVGDR